MAKSVSCKGIELKIMAYIDNELPDSYKAQVEEHIADCRTCQKKFESLKRVKEVTDTMKFKNLPEYYWDEYWQHVYNKLERGVSWILISVGAIILLFFGLWKFAQVLVFDATIPLIIKIGLLILFAGLLILTVSVIREKLLVKKVDKYRKVER